MSSPGSSKSDSEGIVFNESINYLLELYKQGGPNFEDYLKLTETCQTLNRLDLNLNQEMDIYNFVKPILNVQNMIGYTFLKPKGYAGDFEQIHRIYEQWRCTKSDVYHKWDKFYHSLSGCRAVRNRKCYIQGVLRELESKPSPIMLNLGSGPCTDIKEYLDKCPNSNILFHCLDMDSNAIDFAKNECKAHLDKIVFINKNVFRYNTDTRYDLVWSAGMFDYFKDKLFTRLIRNYSGLLKKKSELVVGNFSNINDSRGCMEIITQWYLYHRSEKHLTSLAVLGGIKDTDITVKHEDTGVNLFMHIQA